MESGYLYRRLEFTSCFESRSGMSTGLALKGGTGLVGVLQVPRPRSVMRKQQGEEQWLDPIVQKISCSTKRDASSTISNPICAEIG